MSGFLAGSGVDIYPLLSVFHQPAGMGFWAATVGLVGMSLVDRILGDDEEAEGDDGAEDEGDSGDDIFDADDDLGDLDDVDEWEEGDGFDDDGGSGQAAAEMEPRIEELENEVAGISSTVSTVRSENEAISDTVEEVEENVRKLLDIYEMVTRGVNPFVDDTSGDAFDNDSFGLFGGDQDSSADDEEDPVDDEVMGADADSFFDDDFDGSDDFGDDEMGDDDIDDIGLDDDGLDDDLAVDDEDADDEDDAGGGGKSFDELKAEYESGDADWDDEADDEMEDEEELLDDEEPEDDEGFEFDHAETDEAEGGPDDALDEAAEELIEDDVDEDDWSEETIEEADAQTVEDDSTGAPEVAANGNGTTDEAGKKPYLTRIPDGYTSELIVIEWMDYLRRHADTAETLRAIDYYRNIDWINDRVASDLTEIVRGFEENGHGSDAEHKVSELTIDHHTHSLEYISQLDGSTIDIDLITNWPARGE